MPSAFSVSRSLPGSDTACWSRRQRLVHRAGLGQVDPQLRLHVGARPGLVDRRAQGGDGVGGLAPLPLDEREVLVGERHVGPLGDDLRVDRLGRVELALAEQVDALVDGVVEADRAASGRRPRCRSSCPGRRRRRVAERAQAGERLRVSRPAARRRRPSRRPSARASSARARSGSAAQVVRLGRIRREVVELGDRQVDVLRRGPTSTPCSGAQPRLSDAESASKYDAPVGGVPARQRRAATGRAGRRAPSCRACRARSAAGRRARTGSVGDAAARQPRGRPPTSRDDERNPQRGLVGEQAVRHLAVVAERLAVVADDDDERRRGRTWRGRGRRAARARGRCTPPRRSTGCEAYCAVRLGGGGCTARAGRTRAPTKNHRERCRLQPRQRARHDASARRSGITNSDEPVRLAEAGRRRRRSRRFRPNAPSQRKRADERAGRASPSA